MRKIDHAVGAQGFVWIFSLEFQPWELYFRRKPVAAAAAAVAGVDFVFVFGVLLSWGRK